MKTIITREVKNYLKNPVLWIGMLFILFQLFQLLMPYMKIHYFQSKQEIRVLEPESLGDADIMDGYIPSTEEEQLELALAAVQKDMIENLGMSQDEAAQIINGMKEKNMTMDEMSAELYEYVGKYGLEYYYQNAEIRKATMQEANDYIRNNLDEHSFSWYFGRKFADFSGLFMGFFSAVLLAFLFIRDTKKDTYELLHTMPISASAYIFGKVLGGFFAMAVVWGMLTVIFGGLSTFYGWKQGFPISIPDFFIPAAVYILPNMLMIVCVYTAVALVFKNPLPGAPILFLYMIYSNMGSYGPDGKYGYYGRPLAIMVRFPGNFFETTPPPLALMNQVFLICASAVIIMISVVIWKRRRVY